MTQSSLALTADDTPVRVRHFCLRPLRSIRCDDLRSFLGPEPGVYISDCPEPDWFQASAPPSRPQQLTIRKKYGVFDSMAAGSAWLSPNSSRVFGIRQSKDPRGCLLLHLGTGALRGRAAQVLQTLTIIGLLTLNRAKYKYVLAYNFYFPFFLGAVYAKLILRKRLYVEYEDDYTLVRASRIKNAIERLLRRTVSGAICVNERMTGYFKHKPTCVCNALADLSYAPSADFRLVDGIKFLFGGTLDEIRGADLIPDVVQALRLRISNFEMYVTGTGPLLKTVRSWTIPEVKYCGLLTDRDYAELVKSVDVCLVLQKPDHPFSRGSFPSKVEEYARHQKPIYMLTLA
jgi:hypothetical protein